MTADIDNKLMRIQNKDTNDDSEPPRLSHQLDIL